MVKEGVKFPEDFFELLSQMESDSMHSKVINKMDISEQGILILCERIRQKIKIFKDTKTVYTCHNFIAN